MKYHEFDNRRRYKRVKEKGFTSRDHEDYGVTIDDIFESHELVDMIQNIDLPDGANILLYGAGTGGESCYLSSLGYDVTAVDIVEDALDIAREISKEKGYKIRFIQDDITNMKNEYGMFDAIIDSCCLQSIVMDYERKAVYKFVKSHLKDDGRYIIMSAGYSANKDYTDLIRNEKTGVVLEPVDSETELLDDITIINDKKYFPVRRHYTIDMLVNELKREGLIAEYQATKGEYDGLRVIAKMQ